MSREIVPQVVQRPVGRMNAVRMSLMPMKMTQNHQTPLTNTPKASAFSRPPTSHMGVAHQGMMMDRAITTSPMPHRLGVTARDCLPQVGQLTLASFVFMAHSFLWLGA